MRYDQQIHDHRVLDSDPGATERNVQYADIALQRAAQRNGGQNPPASAPVAVTTENPVPARAVDGVTNAGPDSLSWGRGGEVSPHTEVPPGSSESTPVKSDGAAGNWNMEQISKYPYGD